MKLMNVINSVADSNLAYYLLIIILIIVVIVMIYLIYSQNKEMKEAKKKEELLEKEEQAVTNETVEPVEEIAQELKEEEIKEEEVKEEPKTIVEIPIVGEEKTSFAIAEPAIDTPLKVEKVKTMVDIDLPKEKKQDIIDATLTNLPKVSLLEETMTSIPPIMDYLDNTQDLMDLSKELENAPREKTIEMTPYEEEQEQSAIISYDEILQSKNDIKYEDTQIKDDVLIKQVDLDETPEVKTKETISYAHEEDFLSKLKSLQSKIN